MKLLFFANKITQSSYRLVTVLLLISLAFASQVQAQQESKGLDPTLPLSGSSNQEILQKIKSRLILESIFHGSGLHTVVISGQVMKVNDKIGEYQLVAVNDDSVVLRSSEKRLKLYIFSPTIIKSKH